MATITIPQPQIGVGGALRDLALTLQLTNTGIVVTQQGKNLIYTGSFNLEWADANTIVANGGEVNGILWYGRGTPDLFSKTVPATLPEYDQFVPGQGNVAKTFDNWPDSYIYLYWEADFAHFWMASNPIQNQILPASLVKILVDSFGLEVITESEFLVMQPNLIWRDKPAS